MENIPEQSICLPVITQEYFVHIFPHNLGNFFLAPQYRMYSVFFKFMFHDHLYIYIYMFFSKSSVYSSFLKVSFPLCTGHPSRYQDIRNHLLSLYKQCCRLRGVFVLLCPHASLLFHCHYDQQMLFNYLLTSKHHGLVNCMFPFLNLFF